MAQEALAQQQDINHAVYSRRGVDQVYQSCTLTRAEAATLLKHRQAFAGRDILDIGVGTGRTTIYLHPLARRYEAVDYSPVMVEHVRAKMPEVSVRLADMCELSMFPDESFDFVYGPNNVLDAVSHQDRLRALKEFKRVLRPGGTLIFTSHHLDFQGAGQGPRLSWSRNPTTALLNLNRWARCLYNHRHVAPLRERHQAYALLNDEGHDFACLHYYIGQRQQREQLEQVGLAAVDVLDRDGISIGPDDTSGHSPWLTYVATKPGGGPR